MVQQHLSDTVRNFFGAFSLLQELQDQVSGVREVLPTPALVSTAPSPGRVCVITW